ncbi:MAG: 30S ribosomal protein S11 [Candidatus Saccharibacteria bacterium]|jgi:small subunit ribosomal protein S11
MAKTQAKSATRRRKIRRTVTSGQMHVQATFNNTIVSFTDERGNLLTWSSSGSAGFKGSRKSTPFAAQSAAEKAATAAKDYGLAKVDVFVRGVGSGRESAIRALITAGIAVSSIKDVTGIPHNGCRPRKARRV